MSQFNKYLEIIQEQREYNYDDLEIYDESLKDDLKDNLKKLIIGAIMTASLGISLAEIDQALKRENLSVPRIITASEIRDIEKQSYEKLGKELTPEQISGILKLVYNQNQSNKKVFDDYFKELGYNPEDAKQLGSEIQILRELYQKTKKENEKNYPSIIGKIKNFIENFIENKK